jgi:hypothetical protein
VADVKVPSGLSAAALSAGKGASFTPPTPAAHQQAGHSSSVPAKCQEPAAISSVSPALVSKLPLFFQLLLQRYKDVVNPSKVLPQTFRSHSAEHHLETRGLPIASHFCWRDAQKLAAAKAEFTALERARDHPAVQQPMGLSSSHDEEARWVLALLWQLPLDQQCHRSGHILAAEHDGFLFQGRRVLNFSKN